MEYLWKYMAFLFHFVQKALDILFVNSMQELTKNTHLEIGATYYA